MYTVVHIIKTVDGCLDSAYSRYNNIITVFPVPTSALEINGKQKSIYEPVFEIKNRSTGHLNTITILPNGQRILDLDTEVISIEDTGNFPGGAH